MRGLAGEGSNVPPVPRYLIDFSLHPLCNLPLRSGSDSLTLFHPRLASKLSPSPPKFARFNGRRPTNETENQKKLTTHVRRSSLFLKENPPPLLPRLSYLRSACVHAFLPRNCRKIFPVLLFPGPVGTASALPRQTSLKKTAPLRSDSEKAKLYPESKQNPERKPPLSRGGRTSKRAR